MSAERITSTLSIVLDLGESKDSNNNKIVGNDDTLDMSEPPMVLPLVDIVAYHKEGKHGGRDMCWCIRSSMGEQIVTSALPDSENAFRTEEESAWLLAIYDARLSLFRMTRPKLNLIDIKPVEIAFPSSDDEQRERKVRLVITITSCR